jgi:hypothetical protein
VQTTCNRVEARMGECTGSQDMINDMVCAGWGNCLSVHAGQAGSRQAGGWQAGKEQAKSTDAWTPRQEGGQLDRRAGNQTDGWATGQTGGQASRWMGRRVGR